MQLSALSQSSFVARSAALPSGNAPAPSEPQDSLRLILQSTDSSELRSVRDYLRSHESGQAIRAELPIINGLAVEVAPQTLAGLVGLRSQSLRITEDAPITIPEPFPVRDEAGVRLNVGVPAVGAPQLWEQGLTGKDVTVAVIDTGIAPHPDVASRIIGFKDFVNNRERPYDDNGHGTHCAGIVAGDGTSSDGVYKGAAPEANLVGIKVLSGSGSGSFSDIIKGIQWAVDNRDRYDIKVISMSLGGRVSASYKDDPVAQAVERAVQSGITTLVAAGNSGPGSQTIGTPAHAQNVITVGADDDRRTRDWSDDTVASFSSRGPTKYDALTKPDILAPGVRITSADNASSGYTTKSGTSMATPMAAGVAALLVQSKPGATPAEIKSALMGTAHQLPQGGGPNAQGSGLIDAVAARDRLAAG